MRRSCPVLLSVSAALRTTHFWTLFVLLCSALLLTGDVPAWSAPPLIARPGGVQAKPRLSSGAQSASATPPAAPSSLSVDYPAPTSIRLLWTSNSTSENSFAVERKGDGQPDSAFTPIGSADPVNSVGATVVFTDLSGLSFDTVYDYRVRAVAADGTPSDYSNIAVGTTAPAKPISLSAAAVAGSDSKATLSWVDNANHTLYFQLWRKGPGETTFTYFAGWGNPNYYGGGTPGKGVAFTYTNTGLTVSSAYSYYVIAYNQAGQSDPSDAVTATTFPSNPPGAPSDLQAAGAANPSQINLNWLDNSTTEFGFIVERQSESETTFTALTGANPGAPTVGPSLGTGRVYFSDKTVKDDITYTYRVKATNPAGESAYSNSIAATTVPTAVTGLSASAVSGTNDSIKLFWTSSSKHEDGFNVYREAPGETAFTKRTFVPAAAGPGSSVIFTDVGLAGSASYSYYVTAYNSAGESAPSGTATATTGAVVPTTVVITSPANGATFPVGSSIPVVVTATPAAGTTIFSYTLITNDVPATQSSGSFMLTGLAAGIYTLKAKATDTAGNTAASSGITITVASQPPVITNAALAPATLPAEGGTLTVTATVVDPNGTGLPSVSASLSLDGAALTAITLSNGSSGSAYSGTYTVPANAAGTARVYTAKIQAQNAAGLSASVTAASSCTQASGNPVPVLSSLSPKTASLGTTGFVLTLDGSGFIAASTVSFGTLSGLVPVTGSLSATQLRIAVPDSALTVGGPVRVTVTNPAPAGGTSGPQTFTVTVPVPLAPVLQSAMPGDGQVSLQFTTVANAATYTLKSSAQSGGPYAFDVSGITAAAGATTVTAVDPNQANGILKYYVVSAVGPAGESQNSNELSAVPQQFSQPPVVTLTSPADGTALVAPASVTLTATASSPTGTVAQVEFFQNSVSVGVVKTSPYTLSVSGLANGIYVFEAAATDSSGAVAVSKTATVAVGNPAPGIYILSGPTDQSTVCAGTVVFTWFGYSSSTPTGQLRYEYQNDSSGVWSSPTSETSLTLNGLAEGVHTFALRLLNADGSIVGSPVSRVFFVSLTPPALLTSTVDARDTRAVVNWITSKPTTGQIEFGTTASYGKKAPADTVSDGAHNTMLAGLATQTTYHYRIHFTDDCHDVVTPDQTFATTVLLVPNLEVTGATVPGSFAPLAKIQISWTVLDSGPGDAVTNWTDSVFLSKSSTLDVTAIGLGDFPVNGPINAFTNYTENQSVSIPRVPAGQYYLVIKTNSANTLPETSTADNTVAIPVEITALQDLVVSPSSPALKLKTGAANTVAGQLTLTNLSVGTLSGIVAVVKNAPANLTVKVTPPASLASLQSGPVNYTVTASDASVLSSVVEIDFVSGTTQAAATLNVKVIPPTPLLSVLPMTLQTSMVRGGQRLVDFAVTNNGDAPAHGLTLAVPKVPWLTVTAPPGQGDLAPGATAKLELALTPPADLSLGAYTGTLGVSGTNAAVSIPFSFDCVSSTKANLKVVAQDEFSFFADTHPNVAGARVVLTDSTTDAVAVDALTGSDGVLNTADVPEGNYNVDVSAPNHNSYHGQFAVVAGEQNEIDPFLSRQLVTYTWTVVPVPFTDTYTVVLEATFETHVPAPIVTVSPLSLDLDSLSYDANGSAVVNYTLTNHGFIAAKDTKFNITGKSNYTVTPALTSLGTIGPLSSVIVPVTIVRTTVSHSAGKATAGKLKPHDFAGCVNDSMQGITNWSYDCGGPQTASGGFILYVGGSLAITGCGLASIFENFGGDFGGGGSSEPGGDGSPVGGNVSGPAGITSTGPCAPTP